MAARDHAPDHTDQHACDHIGQPVDVELEAGRGLAMTPAATSAATSTGQRWARRRWNHNMARLIKTAAAAVEWPEGNDQSVS